MKKFLGVVLLSSLLMSFLGCKNNSQEASSSQVQSSTTTSTQKVGYQLGDPEQGQEIAIMKTSKGDIKIRFFPEAAPKAVENFKTHSKDGYYNGLKFHRVINDFMIQGGDPNGNGTGGESIWNKSFEDEFSDKLFNIRGSLSMANSGKNTNGSQFFINQARPESFNGWDYFERVYSMYSSNPSAFTSRYGGTIDMSKITDEIKKLYETNGGNPSLDGAFNTNGNGHTVFGQVFYGMDIVDKIANVETDSSDKPLTDVIIEKIDIVKYGE